LNERHYVALQGRNKTKTAEQYGEDKVHLWRRSSDLFPPILEEGHNESKYNRRDGVLDREVILDGENLKSTLDRVTPYWMDTIVPQIKKKKHVIIAAHGNSLRALVKHLEKLSDEDITEIEIPTGVPLIYDLDDNLHPIEKYYLKD